MQFQPLYNFQYKNHLWIMTEVTWAPAGNAFPEPQGPGWATSCLWAASRGVKPQLHRIRPTFWHIFSLSPPGLWTRASQPFIAETEAWIWGSPRSVDWAAGSFWIKSPAVPQENWTGHFQRDPQSTKFSDYCLTHQLTYLLMVECQGAGTVLGAQDITGQNRWHPRPGGVTFQWGKS